MIENEILEWIKNLKQERDEARAAVSHPITIRKVIFERDEARTDAMRWRQDHRHLMETSAQEIKVALAERDEALAKLEPLKKELDQAIAERTPHDYGVLKTQIEHLKQSLHDARIYNSGLAAELERVKAIPRQSGDLNAELSKLVADMNRAHAAQVKPEPSRLEIAAMFYAADIAAGNVETASIPDECPNDALEHADALIAAACSGGALIAAADAGGGPGTGVPEYGRYVDGKWVGTPVPQTIQSNGGSGGCSPQ
jgi:hypothetical protein